MSALEATLTAMLVTETALLALLTRSAVAHFERGEAAERKRIADALARLAPKLGEMEFERAARFVIAAIRNGGTP